MESRLQSNEIRIPKRFTTSSSSSATTILSNNLSLNSTMQSVTATTAATSYLAINLSTSTNNSPKMSQYNSNNSTNNHNNCSNKNNIGSVPASSSPSKNCHSVNNKAIENLNFKSDILTKLSTDKMISTLTTAGGGGTITTPSNTLLSSSSSSSSPISNNITTLPDFDLDTPCQYFKSSFARSLSLAGYNPGVITNGATTITNQTKSLDFGINFGLPRNPSITEETTQQLLTNQQNTTSSKPPPSPPLPVVTTTTSSGLIFSTFHDNLHYNTLIQQQQQRNKMNQKAISLGNNNDCMDSNASNGVNAEICNDTTTTTNTANFIANNNDVITNISCSSPRKMKFLNSSGNNSNNNNNNTNNNNLNCTNSNVWSTSTTSSSSSSSPSSTVSPSCNNSVSSLRKQNFNRRSLDSSEIELLRLRKECQNLVEENRRLMGLASGMVRGNIIVPANSSNIEAVILQTQVDTLQWQLKQVEASREMYRAVMEEVVRFLERCHRNLESLQNQNQQQQHQSSSSSSTITSSSTSSNSTGTGNNIRPRSMHQMTYRHNDVNNFIESDSSSIISTGIIQTAQQQQPPLGTTQVTVTATQSAQQQQQPSLLSSTVLNQSSLSSIFSNQNMSPRARTSTNIIDANNTTTSVARKNNGSTTLDDDCSSNILLGESTASNINNTTAAISHNNFRDFTWRRSPKRQQMTQLAASASRDVEKLAQEAFRLLRTAQNLLNTQEPDLTQSKTINPDLSFISNCSSINGSNGILHHNSPIPNGIPSVIIPSSVTATLKSNSTTNLDTDPFLISSFSRKVNMRESRLSLRSSTDSSVHSTSSSSKTETDEENNTTLQQIQNNKINITNNTDSNKESPVCSSTISSSTTEDESGFSSISSFQEIGLPLHSTIISNSSILLNNTSNSLSSSNSDESGGNNKTIGGSSGGNNNSSNGDTTLNLDSRNSTLKSVQQQNLVNGLMGLPSSGIHRRWDSAPAVPPRNSLHRFSTVSNSNDEGPTVLWV